MDQPIDLEGDTDTPKYEADWRASQASEVGHASRALGFYPRLALDSQLVEQPLAKVGRNQDGQSFSCRSNERPAVRHSVGRPGDRLITEAPGQRRQGGMRIVANVIAMHALAPEGDP